MSESHWPTATLRASCERLALGACNPWDCYGSKLAETLAAMFEGGKNAPKTAKNPHLTVYFFYPLPLQGVNKKRASGAHFLPRLYPLDRILILWLKIWFLGFWLKKLIKSNTYYSYIRASALNFCTFFLNFVYWWVKATGLRPPSGFVRRLALGACNPWDCYGSKLAETLAAMFEGGQKCPQNSQKPHLTVYFSTPYPCKGEQKRASGAHFLPRLYPLDRILILWLKIWFWVLIKKLIKSNTYYSYIRASALNFCTFFLNFVYWWVKATGLRPPFGLRARGSPSVPQSMGLLRFKARWNARCDVWRGKNAPKTAKNPHLTVYFFYPLPLQGWTKKSLWGSFFT